MSGQKTGSAVIILGDAWKIFGITAVLGTLCALTLYAYVNGQLNNLPAQIPSNNSTTAMIGEPSQ